MRPTSSPHPAPNPQLYDTALEALTPEQAEQLKRADCIRYEDCLDTAFKADWVQFHCQECKVYVPEAKDASLMPGKREWP